MTSAIGSNGRKVVVQALRVLAVCGVFSWGSAPGSGQVAGQLDGQPRRIEIVLQQHSPYVRQILNNAEHRIHLAFLEKPFAFALETQIAITSIEQGQWSTPRLRLGKCFVAETQRGENSHVVIIRPTDVLRPDAAQRRYDAELNNVSAMGGDETQLTTNLQVRVEMMEEESEKQLRILRPLRLPSTIKDARKELRRLSDWLVADEILQVTGVRPSAVANPAIVSVVVEEVRQYLTEGHPGDKPFQHLDEKSIDAIRREMAVGIDMVFAPGTTNAPDRNWSIAQRVDLSSAAVGRVTWRGQFPDRSGATRWLAVRTSPKAVQVSARPDASRLAWSWVEAADGWNFIRVVPREQATEFELTLSGPGKSGHPVVIEASPAAELPHFPF